MISERLTHEAERAAGRYGIVTQAIKALYHSALAHPDLGAPAHTSRVISEAFDIAERFLETEREVANSLFSEIAKEAQHATVSALSSVERSELIPSALEHLSESLSYLMNEQIVQLQRDIALLRSALQRASLGLALKRGQGMSQTEARVAQRLEDAPELLFTFQDRTARRWSADRFIRMLWRHTLLSLYNEVVLLVLADHGIGVAQVLSADGVEQTLEISAYAEMRDSLFHPNANVYLAAEAARVPA